MKWDLKTVLILMLLILPGIVWLYAIWHANTMHFLEDNSDVSLMALSGAVAMIAGALFLSEVTD